MKYTIAVLALFALASCKQDYTCTCTKKDGTVFNTTNWKGSKSDKEEYMKRCDEQTAGYNLQYPLDSPKCVFN